MQNSQWFLPREKSQTDRDPASGWELIGQVFLPDYCCCCCCRCRLLLLLSLLLLLFQSILYLKNTPLHAVYKALPFLSLAPQTTADKKWVKRLTSENLLSLLLSLFVESTTVCIYLCCCLQSRNLDIVLIIVKSSSQHPSSVCVLQHSSWHPSQPPGVFNRGEFRILKTSV